MSYWYFCLYFSLVFGSTFYFIFLLISEWLQSAKRNMQHYALDAILCTRYWPRSAGTHHKYTTFTCKVSLCIAAKSIFIECRWRHMRHSRKLYWPSYRQHHWNCILNTCNTVIMLGNGYPNINCWCNDANLALLSQAGSIVRFEKSDLLIFAKIHCCLLRDIDLRTNWCLMWAWECVWAAIGAKMRAKGIRNNCVKITFYFVRPCTLFASFDISHWIQCKWDNNTYHEQRTQTQHTQTQWHNENIKYKVSCALTTFAAIWWARGISMLGNVFRFVLLLVFLSSFHV